MATVTTKVGPKGQVTIPKSMREALKIRAGDLVEARLVREGALIRPLELRPRHLDIEKELEAAEADVKAGRVSGPFTSGAAVLRAAKRHRRRARRHSN